MPIFYLFMYVPIEYDKNKENCKRENPISIVDNVVQLSFVQIILPYTRKIVSNQNKNACP